MTGGNESGLSSGLLAHAAGVLVPTEPIALESVVDGNPESGFVAITEFGGQEIGVWVHTVGASTDVEADEVFIVIAGMARIDFADGSLASLEVSAGDVVQLQSGQKTVWTVTETLRKVYITG